MFAFVFLAVFIKMLVDRWRYAKEVVGKLRVLIFRKAGQPIDKLMPVETIAGQACVKIKTKEDADPVIHILGERGEFPWVYPAGKSSFVQAQCQGIAYVEGDSEPISNTTDVPEISARMFGSIVQSTSLATSSAMQKSESDVPGGTTTKGKSPLKWVYVLQVITIGVIIISIGIIVSHNGAFDKFVILWKTTMGLK
jgi:hypothetical protein